MPSIKEFVATNTYHTEDKGYSAFETLGRRVGGQYDQAGNDTRDAGRARAAAINMIGRWPFNVIDLEQRSAKQAAGASKKGGGGASVGGGGGHSGGSRHAPSYPAFDQMSEGAGAFGDAMRGGGRHSSGSSVTSTSDYPRGSGSRTTSDRDGYSWQVLKERDRQQQLYNAAQQKSWDSYQKGLNEYNKVLNENAAKPVNDPIGVSGDPSSPYYDERQTSDFGGGGDALQRTYGTYAPDGSYTGETSVDPSTSTWSVITNGLSSLFGGSTSSSPAAEADISDFNPSY